jgi:hypothetical protein
MRKRLFGALVAGCAIAAVFASTAKAVEVIGPNPDPYPGGCVAHAWTPGKSNGIFGAPGAIDCIFHHTRMKLKVCLQVQDITEGWVNFSCVEDCRGQECQSGSGIFSNTYYALQALSSSCYNPARGIMYRTWAQAAWLYGPVFHSSTAITPGVYIPC